MSTTPRGSTTVANRVRTDTVDVSPPDRRPPAVAPSRIPQPIRNFAAAVESGEVARIKQAYPGLTPNQQQRWENLFKQFKPGRARIQDVRGIPSNEAGITVVEFEMAVGFNERTTGTPYAARPSRYRARLKREGPTLLLLSLTDVAPRR
jgi:hypothetical protein